MRIKNTKSPKHLMAQFVNSIIFIIVLAALLPVLVVQAAGSATPAVSVGGSHTVGLQANDTVLVLG